MLPGCREMFENSPLSLHPVTSCSLSLRAAQFIFMEMTSICEPSAQTPGPSGSPLCIPQQHLWCPHGGLPSSLSQTVTALDIFLHREGFWANQPVFLANAHECGKYLPKRSVLWKIPARDPSQILASIYSSPSVLVKKSPNCLQINKQSFTTLEDKTGKGRNVLFEMTAVKY